MKQHLSSFGIHTAVIVISLFTGDLSLHAGTMIWTNTASGNWNTAANWDPNSSPGTNDTAIITNAGVTVFLNSPTTVGGITLGTFGAGTTTLSLNGQTLVLNGPLAVYPSGSFTVDSGTLAGNTNAALSGTIGRTAGTLGGILTLASGSTLNITTGNNHFICGCTLTNFGTVNWSGGYLYAGGGAALYNYGLWNAQDDQQLQNYSGGSTIFNNYGTLLKSGGAGEFAAATTFTGGVLLNQLAGVIDVQNGTNGLQLAFEGGGNFTGGYITTNQFGLTTLSSGTYTLTGTVTGTNTWLTSNSTLVGTNVINGGLTWVGGSWNNTVVTVSGNSTLNVIGGSTHFLGGCLFTNSGTVNWSGCTLYAGGDAVFYNYGLWNAQDDQQLQNYYGGSTVFNNYGTLRKSGGAGEFAAATIIAGGVLFNQLAGVIDVQNGTNGLELAFQGGGNFTGGYITANQFGLTVLSAGNFTLNGTVTGTNTWQDAGNLAGTSVINGTLTWVGGTWSGAVVTISTNSTVLVVGGGGNNDLNAAVVTNYGTVAWASGRIRDGNGALVYNYGLWDAQSDQAFGDDFGYGTVFNNRGTFRKSGGTNAAVNTMFLGGVLFNQTGGLLDVESGNVVLQGSGNFNGGSIPNGAGATYLSQGSFNINGTVTGTNVIENSGNLVGTNVINGALTWVAGNWNGALVTISTNSTVTVAGGGGNNDLNAAVVTNYGTVAWASGRIRGGNGALIYNYGLWDAQSDQVFGDDYGYGTVFNNLGTLRKSGGAGEFTAATVFTGGVVFNHLAGVVDVQNGTNGWV
jgi:hypothetical protein